MELYYLGSRYYDAYTGRFISPDDTAYLGVGDNLSSYNLYSYCGNNPVMGYDPTGNFAISTLLIGLAISSLISWGLSEVFGAQIVGGASSIANGAGAIQTGLGLEGFKRSMVEIV